ncbi:MAG: hypothetical protein ABI455_01970 [Candidatus Dormiibacterota bacterium]
MRALFPLPLLVGAALLTGCGGSAASSAPASTASSQSVAAAPQVLPISSLEHDIASGKPVVLLFMAPGCVSCAAEATAATSAVGSHPGVDVVGVDMLSGDTPADLGSFLSAANLDTLPMSWTVDVSGTLTARYNVVNLGETVGLVHGIVRFHNVADADATLLGTEIARLS